MMDERPAPDRPGRLPDGRSYAVTGASGFIGRHLVERLTALGRRVQALSPATGFDVTRDELPAGSVDWIFHLAARTGVAEAWHDPLGFFGVNAAGTVRVLEQCRRRGLALCYVSSFLRGAASDAGARETDAVRPDNPYALSKLVGELACAFYGSHFGVKTVILRPANIYGPGQARSFLIPHIVSQLVDDAAPEILVQDLAPRRDYIHVDDVVDAILLSTTAPAGSTFNISSGTTYSVEEIIRRSCQVAGRHKPYRATGRPRPHEIAQACMDATAAHEALGWRPAVSLERGLQSVIESMR